MYKRWSETEKGIIPTSIKQRYVSSRGKVFGSLGILLVYWFLETKPCPKIATSKYGGTYIDNFWQHYNLAERAERSPSWELRKTMTITFKWCRSYAYFIPINVSTVLISHLIKFGSRYGT